MALFSKTKTESAPVADAPVAETVIEVTKEPEVRVVAVGPMVEAGVEYQVGQVFSTTEPRARRLQELGMIRLYDPSTPGPSRLADAKAAANAAYEKAHTCSREIAQVERSLEVALKHVAEVEQSISAAVNLDEVKGRQEELSTALANVEATKRLLTSARGRRVQAEHAKTDAEKTVRQIESRIAEITKGLIPAAERTIAMVRKDIADLEQKVAYLRTGAILTAQQEREKLIAELQHLQG